MDRFSANVLSYLQCSMNWALVVVLLIPKGERRAGVGQQSEETCYKLHGIVMHLFSVVH